MSQGTVDTDSGRELTQRIAELEGQVKTLVAAVHALAEGLAPDPVEGQTRVEAAQDGARLAHDLLIAAGL